MADQPTYTRIPNYVIEAMASMSEPELRVILAIARKTVGWQKACDVISITQLEAITGLSRPAVVNGIDGALKRGLIAREPATRNGFCYRLVNDVNQSTELTSKPGLLELVNDVNYSSPPLVNDVNTQKKDLKKEKEKDSRTSRKRADASTTPEIIRTALADVCKVDMQVGTKEQIIQVNQTAVALWKAGQKAEKGADEVADTIRYVADYFRRFDWRGKKGDTPRPSHIREVWREAIANRAPPIMAMPAPPTDLLTPEQIRQKFARMNGVTHATPTDEP